MASAIGKKTGALRVEALFRRVAAMLLAASLVACGGGGGAVDTPSPAPAPPPPSASPAAGPIPAQLSVPAPVGYDAERRAAFDRLNAIRLSAGLGLLAQSTAMDSAAQAHAAWMVTNDVFAHEETAGTVGFTGTTWPLRDEAFGYTPVEGAEVLSTAGSGGAVAVEGLVNVLYHRAALLAIEPDDVGVGWSASPAASFAMPLVIDLTRPGNDPVRGLGQVAQEGRGGVVLWPLDGATDVPVRMGQESPNPVPSHDVSTLGTPASITVDASKTIVAASFTLTDHSTGIVFPTQLLASLEDPNGLLPHSFIAVVPLAPLAAATRYDVAFTGSTLDFGATAPVSLTRRWSFTTGVP